LEKLRPCPPQHAVGFTIAAATAPWRWTDAFLLGISVWSRFSWSRFSGAGPLRLS
jgi:hypothetical protein